MTEDQYGQARGTGYGASGDVVDDNTEDQPDQGKPMTRFQKVASALRGDRPDRDEADEEQLAADQADPSSAPAEGPHTTSGYGMATDAGTAADAGTTAGYGTAADAGTAGDAGTTAGYGTAADARTAAGYGTTEGYGTAADARTTAGNGTATDTDALPDSEEGRPANSPWGSGPDRTATAAGGQRGDYWDVPNPREDQVATVTSPDNQATDTGMAPLTSPDETRPDIADTQDPALTPDTHGSSREDGDPVTEGAVAGDRVAGDRVAGDSVAGDPVAGDRVAGDPVAGDQAGAATISDAPVTQQDAAAAEAPGGTGRHAGAGPGQELRPGEADSTLDDLGDLAYGNLLPDASHFTEQWQQIQFRFVDDPQASVTEAAEVVAQVTAKLEAAIQERQRAIAARQQAIQERQRSLRGRWSEGTEADTETLRETLRMYRAFLDQLIGPKA